jgi:TRAP-type C4-dicarboxylate transport system permease small subunit
MPRLNAFVAVILFAILTTVVALQVVNRLILHWALIWSEEAARFLFLWVVMLGAAIGVRRRRHFVLDLWERRRAGRFVALRFVLDLVPDLCVLGFSVFLLFQGIGYARAGLLRTATNSGVNMGVVFAAIPVFAALSLLYSSANLLTDYRAFRSGRLVAPRPEPAE